MERLADLQWSYQSVCKRNEHTKIFFKWHFMIVEGLFLVQKACPCRIGHVVSCVLLWVFFCLFVSLLTPQKSDLFFLTSSPFSPPFIHVFTTTVQTCRCGRFLLDLYKRAVSPLLIFFFFFHFCFSASVSWCFFFFFFLSLKLCFDEEEEKKDTKRKTTSVLSIRKRKTNM